MRLATRTLGIALGATALLGLVAGTAARAGAAATCADQLPTVKAELKKATAGPKADEAKKDYKAAVAAHKKNDDVTCVARLNAAEAALK
jgi:hypothetical protein